jgi:hypothetical protein
MWKSTLLLLALWPALATAQKKPITLETLYESPRRTAAGAGAGSPVVWAPDGKTFLLRRDGRLAIYDPATKSTRELIPTYPMDSAAVAVPHEDEPEDWTNRRARSGELQFSDSGK